MRERVAVLAGVAGLVALSGGFARAQVHEGCPLHQAHRQRAAVDHRHQETTGLPSDGVEHHFLLSESGGTIRLEVKDARQVDDRARVREHLRAIARAFAAGDFSMPARIHDRVPPGAEAMKARTDVIRYTYSDTPRGGEVAIATSDKAALGAVHEFLRFQVDDHGTGDPIR
jgi:hypothetical protein